VTHTTQYILIVEDEPTMRSVLRMGTSGPDPLRLGAMYIRALETIMRGVPRILGILLMPGRSHHVEDIQYDSRGSSLFYSGFHHRH
jgi:hypothetical protein